MRGVWIWLLALAACSGGESRPEQIYPWPFTVDHVTLNCRNPAGTVTATAPNGAEYALNGFAARDYPRIDPIWAADPATPGLKISIGAAIERALSLCEHPESPQSIEVVAGSAPPQAPARPAAALPAAAPPGTYHLGIVDAAEENGAVRGHVSTDIPLPVEVMVSVSLHGQRDDEVYIGNDQTVRIESSPQAFSIPLRSPRGSLPSGLYDVEVAFYPRWGAEHGPVEARRAQEELHASTPVRIHGSGESSTIASRRNEAQRWVMENVNGGDQWDLDLLERHLGPAERFRITGDRNPDVVAGYYFARSDVTVFMSIPLNQVLVWRLGRETSL